MEVFIHASFCELIKALNFLLESLWVNPDVFGERLNGLAGVQVARIDVLFQHEFGQVRHGNHAQAVLSQGP